MNGTPNSTPHGTPNSGTFEFHLIVVDPARAGAVRDVAITACRGAPLSAVHEELLRSVGSPARSGLFCAGRRLDGTATLGLPPLLHGATLTVRTGSASADGVGAQVVAALQAHVVAGPDAGTVVPLPPGSTRVGRAVEATVRIADPDVSRVHAELSVATDGVWVADLGSTNGSTVDGAPVDGSRRLPVGAALRLGASTLIVRGPDRAGAAMLPDGTGHLLVNRAPRLTATRPEAEIRYPAPPSGPSRLRLPWPTLLLPILSAVPLALWWRQPAFLLLMLMTPALVLGQHVVERSGRRRDEERRRRRHEQAVAAVDTRLSAAVSADADYIEAANPDLALLAETATGPTERLWERRIDDPDAVVLRLGRGRAPSTIMVSRAPEAGDVAASEPRDPSVEHVFHDDVPISVNLRETRVLGVSGPREAALGLVRGLVGQAAVLHSPSDLRITVLSVDPDPPEWRWVPWLPHAVDVPDSAGGPLVVVLDGAQRLRLRPDVAALFAADGVVLICLDEEPGRLPVECRTVVSLHHDGPASATVYRPECPGGDPFRPDLAGRRWAWRVARALAPLRDAIGGASERLPSAVRLVDLLRSVDGVDARDPADLTRHWRQGGRPATAALGVGAAGPHVIDLRRDGPHVLIGGTTGAGKSELLRSLVAALAVSEPPDRVAFLLVDYKGGSAFRDCAGLPHVTGVVTDLDEHLSQRALASLGAELRRRERLLRGVGASDLDEYAVRRDRLANAPPSLPRLVVVVDEFRVLAEELPDFVAGVVRLAAVGRSLGVHLVLATQRPGGAISADLRANVNLRIALRVRDAADSLDVLDVPDAASLPADTPGRAIARTGGGEPMTFQVAQVSGNTQPFERPSVRALTAPVPLASPSADSSATSEPAEPTDLAAIAAAATEAARALGCAPAVAPWKPPLPTRVELSRLAAPPDDGSARWAGFLLADHPERQAQNPAGWRLAGRQLAVAGGPRSGRTTALRSIAEALSASYPPDQLHVHGIDGGGGLRHLVGLPNVGAIVPASDTERAGRLLRRLGTEIDQRRIRAGDGEPDIVLLLDGWEPVVEAWAPVDHGRLVDDLLRVLRDGAGCGIHAAVAGGRAVLTGPAAPLLSERLALRFADAHDAALAGIRPARLPASQPPGRGLLIGPDDPEGTLVQVAWPDGVMPVHAAAAPSPRLPRPAGPWRIAALPDSVSIEQLAAICAADPVPSLPGWVPIGIGGDDAAAVGFDLDAEDGVLVLGAASSGRSTALAVIGWPVARRNLPVLALGSPGSPLHAWATELDVGISGELVRHLDPHRPDAADELTKTIRSAPRTTVLVDDATALPPGIHDVLEDLATTTRGSPGRPRWIVAATPNAAVTAFRGLLACLRPARTGLLLGAVGPGDGDALGVRVPPGPAGPPGRAVLVVAGRTTTCQLATFQLARPAAVPPGSQRVVSP